MYPKSPLFQKCVAYLESLPNLKVIVQEEFYPTTDVLSDGQLTITNSYKSVSYVYELQTNITNDFVEKVVEYLINLGKRLINGQRPLLITSHLSNLVIEHLLEKNIEFIDVDGNIYLNNPDFYILIRKQVAKDSKHQSLSITPAALQVIYAILKQPSLLYQNYINEIATISGVTSKTVKTTLKKLNDLKYLQSKYGGYKIIDYIKLFERWELGYSESLRPKLLIGTYIPAMNRDFSELEPEIIEFADQYDYLIGGELAASFLTPELRPISVTLHLNKNSNEREIAVKLKLKPDPKGNIIFIRSFSHAHHQGSYGLFDGNLIDPLLIHAELIHSGNSRLKEVAHQIYDHYIEDCNSLYVKND